jgi:CheY-like chemotaxis protein
MTNGGEAIPILMAEDDLDDQLLTTKAMEANRLHDSIRFVADGVELMDYLLRRAGYADPKASPRPRLLLLDLNMPRRDGREVLAEIKADPALRFIPVVVFTTSQAEEDIVRSYELGASSFITKPVSFQGYVDAMRDLARYWFELVRLPKGPRRR